ncbi:MAG: hypothetical protein OXC63_16240 [Aestuariivita sp.]|nr:hypothetical protein [Aestuariivita sp.]
MKKWLAIAIIPLVFACGSGIGVAIPSVFAMSNADKTYFGRSYLRLVPSIGRGRRFTED